MEQYNTNQQYPNPGQEGGPRPPYYQRPSEPEKKKSSKFGVGIAVGVLITLAVVMIAVVAFVFFFLSGRLTPGNASLSEEEKIQEIKQYLNAYYLGELDEDALTDGIAKGLLYGTGDKYADYYNQEEFSMMLEDSAGVYSGIGVSVAENTNGKIEVNRVFSGSPADEAGIREKDIVVEAAGERDFEDLDALVKLVRGKEGTSVDLVVERDGKEIPITVERRSINMETVEYEMLENKIGYIQLLEFDTISVEQFNQALDDLQKQGAVSLILDLRNNPGGDYDSVMKMADRVLPEGVIAHIVDKDGEKKEERSDEEHKVTLPMVVLINEGSASAAELFSGAIKDYGIATMVGKTTYGKGVIQSIYRLSDGSGMKFTTEEYLTPKENHINGIGVSPDIEVDIPKEAYEDGELTKEEDAQLQKAIEVLTKKAQASAR